MSKVLLWDGGKCLWRDGEDLVRVSDGHYKILRKAAVLSECKPGENVEFSGGDGWYTVLRPKTRRVVLLVEYGKSLNDKNIERWLNDWEDRERHFLPPNVTRMSVASSKRRNT